uniref:NADH dehydrogenase subunit 6 n=1 Tax=Leptychaster arcticus TaxID=3048001 RepID=UPI00286AE78E|nr:NADH dehydrogenase subunit 6 [Leptychaster arcticus]WKD83338.1 NADH dehydrogenase subunit 6 [Leptychaster arcticus]
MIFYLVFVVMFLGGTLVFYSLSPYYGALGLVFVALSGCILVGLIGVSFMALVLILIYMGGMLVVFVYSTAISAERYPLVSSNFKEVFSLGFLVVIWVFVGYDPFLTNNISEWTSLSGSGLLESSNLYGEFGWYLLGGGLHFISGINSSSCNNLWISF